MAKTPNIQNEIEKQNIIIFLSTNVYPQNISYKEKRNIKRKAKSFILQNGVLYVTEEWTNKRYISGYDSQETIDVMNEEHLPGHVGINLLRYKLSKKYTGININSIKEYIKSCLICQRDSIPHITAFLTPIVPSFVRERLIVDTIDLSQYAEGNDHYRYLFIFIDSFSKFTFVFPSLRRDSDSVLVILKQFFYSNGPWKIFHSDNGGEFTSNSIKSLLNDLNIEDVQGSPYHPQSQGQIKRFNRTIKSRVRKYLGEVNIRYIEMLPKILYQYNTSSHEATKTSPFVLFLDKAY